MPFIRAGPSVLSGRGGSGMSLMKAGFGRAFGTIFMNGVRSMGRSDGYPPQMSFRGAKRREILHPPLTLENRDKEPPSGCCAGSRFLTRLRRFGMTFEGGRVWKGVRYDIYEWRPFDGQVRRSPPNVIPRSEATRNPFPFPIRGKRPEKNRRLGGWPGRRSLRSNRSCQIITACCRHRYRLYPGGNPIHFPRPDRCSRCCRR